ncbi:MAG: hypothetical protein K9W46_03495 [Candidatus Heimdallarchaeum endolithica]|uniref:FH2 domain-containing protein n=1 Tax=Candidatus Heimdallarchaeum endolithica TaxID=2876572 RepID=A0A9Y1BS88_9ARCH|nr:MAG: hypothetical protein K9W46_03495 [Candidatus Heimdallarchaeum endolithica]
MAKGKDIEQILESVVKIADTLSELKSSIEVQLDVQKKDNTKKITDLKEDLKQYINDTEKNFNNKIMDISELIISRSNLQDKKIEELKNEISNSSSHLEEMNKMIEKKEEEIKRLNTLLDEKEALISQLKEKQVMIEKDLEAKMREFNNLKLETEQLNVENTDLSSKVIDLERQLKDKKEELEKIKQEKEQLKEEKEKSIAQEKEFQETKREEQSSLLRILLNSTDHGRVFLALQDSKSNSLTLDELTAILNSSAVEVKRAVSFMHEIGVVIYKPESRRVILAS